MLLLPLQLALTVAFRVTFGVAGLATAMLWYMFSGNVVHPCTAQALVGWLVLSNSRNDRADTACACTHTFCFQNSQNQQYRYLQTAN